ncbi:MAG: hypothetical protein MJY62_04385, partial [Bacteroidales bacterium]|nr:hypothetical protein [Bacteroidales bacterium]
MRKLQKIVSILRGAFISLAVLILTVMLVMEMPSVQTWLSHKLLDRFADNSSFEITCGRILVRPFHTVVIRDLLVIDKHPHEAAVEKLALLDDKSPVDTFAAAGLVEARLSFRTLLGGGPVEFGKILVKDGVFNLVIEPSLYPQLPAGNNLIRIFGINPTLPKPEDDGNVKFKAKNVKVRNFHYTMRNVSSRRPPVNDRGIDWGDLDTYGINCDAHDLMLKGMVMSGVCDHLDAHEKSGYFLSHISAAAEVGGGRAYVSDIHLDDGHSDAYLDHYAMYFHNARTFLHFVDSVSIDGHINRGSHLDSYSLQYFVPIFWEKEMSMDVHGDVVGTLTDLNVCGLRIDSVNLREKNGCPRMSDLTAFSASFDGHISGITDMHTPRRPISARARLDSCRTTATDFYAVAMRFLEGATASATGLPFNWAGTMILHPEIELEGSTDSDFKASVSIDAGEFREFGNLRCTAVAAGLPGNAPDSGTPSASGKAPSAPTPLTADIILSSTDLNLKPFTGNENLGPVSLEARCSMTIPNGTENILKEADIDLSSLEINRLQFKGYDYSGICASGKLSSGKARLSLLGRDPSLDCDLSASGNLNFKTADISLDLRDFALSETKLFGKDNVRTSLVLDAALAPEYSEVALTDMTLSRSGDSTAIPSVSAIAVRDSTGYGITVTSDMVEAVYRGDDNPVKFVENFIALALKKNVPGLFRDSGFESDGKRYSLDVTSGDLSPLLGFFAPSLSIESGTSLKTVISEEGMVNADLRAKHVIYKNAVADGLKFNFSNRQNAARAMLLATDIRLKDRKISSPSVQVYGSSGNIGLGISYDREDMSGGHGELFVRGQIDRNDPQNRLGISLEILPSTIYFSSSSWKIGRSSAEILGNAFKINDFNASCRDRNIFVSGSHGFTDRDKLRLYVENLDLSVVDDIMKNVELGLKGIIHGDMVLDSRGVTGRFLSEDTFIGGTALGTLEITDRWSDEDQKFHFRVNTDRMIKVVGDLSPKTKEINAGVVLDSLDISFARIFAKDVIGDIRGGLSGNIILGGTLPDFTLRSEGLNLVSGSVNVIPTGATYLLSGPLNITEDNFDVNLKIGDSSGGSGNISGGFRHDRFKNMNLGLNLEHSRLQTIALEPSRQRPYSGSLRTSGKIAVSGPTDNLSVDGTISTAGEGKVNVDISNMAPENSNQILSFVQKKNDEDGTPSGMLKHTTRKSGIKINAGICLGIYFFTRI